MEVLATSGGGGKGAAKWSVSDVERFAKLAGVAADENPTSAIMTGFYQGLERDHNKVDKVRIYVKERLMVNAEPGALSGMNYRTVFGSSEIAAIRNIDACGGFFTQ